MDRMLTVSHVSKKYPGFSLEDVSFELPSGSIMGLVGENGAGKTTTLKLILNELRRDRGEITVFGMDNRKQEQQIKEQLGVVFDESYFHQEFQARDIGKIMRSVYRQWDDALYNQYLQQFQLPPTKIIKDYSRGMKMKLSIATALAHRPKLLILDEATSGLDPIVRNEMLDLFLDFIQDEGHSILFSSHITSDLEKVADYITFLHAGKVVFSRSKDDLMYQYGVAKCGASQFEKLDRADIIGYRHSAFGYEVLVSDRDRCKRKYPGLVIDNTTLDEIMLFYVNPKNDRKERN